MSLFGRSDQSVTANSTTTAESTKGAPIGTYVLVKGDKLNRVNGANAHFGNTSPGSRANTDAAMFNNDTPGAFINNMAVGIYGVSATEMSNNTLNSAADQPAHAGWVVRRSGTGGIASAVFATPTTGGANGETVTVSNGTSNATLVITTNTTGGGASLAIQNAGSGWANVAQPAITFNREKHVTNVAVSGASSGYDNSSVIVISNGTVNAVTQQFSTNSTGGFTANLTMTTVGLFDNAKVAGNLKLTIANVNSAVNAIGNTTITAFTPVLANSASGTLTLTLGGRAGRVHTETLVAMGSLGAQTAAYGTAATVADSGTDASHYPGS